MKRLMDIVLSTIVLIVASPILFSALVAVWLYDFAPPIYRARRCGLNGQPFLMLKIRSMCVDADRVGGTSTSGSDSRITPVGHVIRRFKLDELSQFWNVLVGDMSVVGPRPNTVRDAELYTPAERRLLAVRPGITDISSIVFSDEGKILAGAEDADALYDRIIRPWKSRLGLIYVDQRTALLDLQLIVLTATALISKPSALAGVEKILIELSVDPALIEICRREHPLPAGLPPGAVVGG